MATGTAEPADDFRESHGCITSYVCRRLSFQVYSKLRRYGHGKMVYLMYKSVRKLRTACSRPNDDNRTEAVRVAEREPAVPAAFHHYLFCPGKDCF